jgi:hypothetical protein
MSDPIWFTYASKSEGTCNPIIIIIIIIIIIHCHGVWRLAICHALRRTGASNMCIRNVTVITNVRNYSI